MNRNWISLLLTAFILASAADITWAGISEGQFTPCLKNQAPYGISRETSHRIQKGDTLWSIARHYGVKTDTLMMINRLDESSVLAVGKDLQIPGTNARVHVVKSGETLWQIAGYYGVGVEELQRLNSGKAAEKLQIGERLNLPATAKAIVPSANVSRGLPRGGGFFSWPIVGAITSAYGWRQSGFHHGLDIAGKLGDPIRAAANGKVDFVGYQPIYGQMVILKHDDNKKTVYAHLDKACVKRGQEIERGKTIGSIGLSGRTTGPHLHFEVRVGDVAVNPSPLLR